MRPNMGSIQGLNPDLNARPEQWPPDGWPACPDRGLYEAAVRQHRENMDRERQETTPGPQGRMDEAQFILAEEIAGILCAQRADQNQRARQARTLEDHLVFAASLTTGHSIGAGFIRMGQKRGRNSASFGVMHRHPGWAGLCWKLSEVKGMEALIFLNAKHEPDVIMVAPRELLGIDPATTTRCAAGTEAAREGINQALAAVFRHHQANPHHIDLCGESGDGLAVLAGLMGTAASEQQERRI